MSTATLTFDDLTDSLKRLLNRIERAFDYLYCATDGEEFHWSMLSDEASYARLQIDTIRIDGRWSDDNAYSDLVEFLQYSADRLKDTWFAFSRRNILTAIADLKAEKVALDA